MRRTLSGTACLDAPGVADRKDGRAQSPSEVQATRRPALVERGSEEAKDVGSRKYTDRSAELETATAAAAIRSKARREGISLKPTNRSPYNRRER